MMKDGLSGEDRVIAPGTGVLGLERRDVEQVVPGWVVAPGLSHRAPLVKRAALQPGGDAFRLQPQMTGLLLDDPPG